MLDIEFYVVVFSFNTVHISLYSLVCIVCSKKSNVILILFPLQVRYFPPLAYFKIFSLSSVFCSLNMICLGVEFLSTYPGWCSLSLLDLRFGVCH